MSATTAAAGEAGVYPLIFIGAATSRVRDGMGSTLRLRDGMLEISIPSWDETWKSVDAGCLKRNGKGYRRQKDAGWVSMHPPGAAVVCDLVSPAQFDGLGSQGSRSRDRFRLYGMFGSVRVFCRATSKHDVESPDCRIRSRCRSERWYEARWLISQMLDYAELAIDNAGNVVARVDTPKGLNARHGKRLCELLAYQPRLCCWHLEALKQVHEAEEQAQAFAMATHARLGAESHARHLSGDVLQLVGHFIFNT